MGLSELNDQATHGPLDGVLPPRVPARPGRRRHYAPRCIALLDAPRGRRTRLAPSGLSWREELRRHSQDVARRRGIDLTEAMGWLRLRPHLLARPFVIESDRATRPGIIGDEPAIVLAVRVWDRAAPEGWTVALIEARTGRDTYSFDPDFSTLLFDTEAAEPYSWSSLSDWMVGLLCEPLSDELLAREVRRRAFVVLPESDPRWDASGWPFLRPADIDQATVTFLRRGV